MAVATVEGHSDYDPDGSLARSQGVVSDGQPAEESAPEEEPVVTESVEEDPGPAAEEPAQTLGAGTEEPPEPEKPRPSDPKGAWVAYAVSQGLDEDEANAMTKPQLQEAYGD